MELDKLDSKLLWLNVLVDLLAFIDGIGQVDTVVVLSIGVGTGFRPP